MKEQNKIPFMAEQEMGRMHYIINRFVVGKIIHPAQIISSWRMVKFIKHYVTGKDILDLPPENVETDRLKMTRYFVESSQKAKIDTVEFIHKAHYEKPITEKHYHIFFCGNGNFINETYYEAKNTLGRTQYNGICFSYRGVGESSDFSVREQDLYNDGIAQVNNLLEKGVLPEHIHIKGTSLGGSIATNTAYHLYKHHGTLGSLYNERSFSNLAVVAASYTSAALEPFYNKLLNYLSMYFDALTPYIALPAEKKECAFAKDDKIVPESASLVFALKQKKETSSGQFNIFFVKDERLDPHKVKLDALFRKTDSQNREETMEDHYVNFIKGQSDKDLSKRGH